MPDAALSDEHANLLEVRRGIPADIATALGVVSQGNKIGFQYRRKGVTLFTKWRGPDKKFYIEPAGVPLLPWNLDSLEDSSGSDAPLIISEGELDAASCVVAGASYVLSVPNGAPSKPGEGDIVPSEDRLFAWLWQGDALMPEIDKFTRIILFTDGDGPGQVLAGELAIRLGKDRCATVTYPKDVVPALGRAPKDANEILVHLGVDALTDVIADALPLVPDRLSSLADVPPRPNRLPYKSGWISLDNNLRLSPPELVVVSGVPNAGKSQWVLAWLLNLSRMYGIRGAVLQFEDDLERLRGDVVEYSKAWERDTGTSAYLVATGERPVYHSLIASMGASDFIRGMIKIVPPSIKEKDTLDLAWVQSIIHEAATRHGCKWVLLDPWNEIEHAWAGRDTQANYLNQALRQLKRLARRYEIAIVIVAHPDKNAGVHQSFDDMSLYSIDGGAAWNNKADHGIIIGRLPDDTSVTQVKVCKSKDWNIMGRPGMVKMRFDAKRRTYSSC